MYRDRKKAYVGAGRGIELLGPELKKVKEGGYRDHLSPRRGGANGTPRIDTTLLQTTKTASDTRAGLKCSMAVIASR